jgi:hypothetical protein
MPVTKRQREILRKMVHEAEAAGLYEKPEVTTRPKMTWRCDTCGAEWDYFTYGGPCPGWPEGETHCGGELQRCKVRL